MNETKTETLWCVNIAGPDDVMAVDDYLTAVKVANAFNAWWQERIALAGLHPYDPHMWARPIEWMWSAEGHAESVANSSSEYSWLLADRLPTLREAQAAAALLSRCNGHDLSVWTDDIWPSDELRDAYSAISKVTA